MMHANANADPELRKIAIILGHAIVGWVLCGLVIAIGMSVTTQTNALIAHAILGPLLFAAISWIYFRHFGYTTPAGTAAIFLAVVVFMDFFVVALLIERSFAMFASVIGTWLPWMLIFALTYLSGRLVRHQHPEAG